MKRDRIIYAIVVALSAGLTAAVQDRSLEPKLATWLLFLGSVVNGLLQVLPGPNAGGKQL